MHRANFMGSLASQCRVCAIRALVVTVALMGPAVLPAVAQERPEQADFIEVMPASTIPVSPMLASRIPASPMLASRTSSSPALLHESPLPPSVERSLSFAPAGNSNFADSRSRTHFGLDFEKQRTPFQSQVRLPIREFFGGRMELACVHSKSRHVSEHSAVPRSQQGYRLHSPYSSSLLPRRRASLSLGLWFRIGG